MFVIHYFIYKIIPGSLKMNQPNFKFSHRSKVVRIQKFRIPQCITLSKGGDLRNKQLNLSNSNFSLHHKTLNSPYKQGSSKVLSPSEDPLHKEIQLYILNCPQAPAGEMLSSTALNLLFCVISDHTKELSWLILVLLSFHFFFTTLSF